MGIWDSIKAGVSGMFGVGRDERPLERKEDYYARAGITDEKLSAGPRGVSNFPNFLPYYDPDQAVHETPVMRAAYRDMLADPNIKAGLFNKILPVSSLDLKIHPHDKKDERAKEQAEFCQWNFTRRMHEGIQGLAWNILSGGLVDGYSVNEPVIGVEEKVGKWKGKNVLRKLKAKDVNQDLVLEVDQYKNITGVRGLRYSGGEIWKPDNFIIYSHLGMFGNPTGMSDFRAVYGRYWFLDAVIKLRGILLSLLRKTRQNNCSVAVVHEGP